MDAAVAEQIRSTVEARLRELAPALSEFQQLQSVLAVLDDPDACLRLAGHGDVSAQRLAPHGEPDLTPTGAVHGPSSQNPRRLGSRPGADGRAPQGANKQRILAVIAEHPGIAAPQIARLTGLKRPVVASTISRLKRTGELCAHERGVRLVDATDASNVFALSRLNMLASARPAGRLHSAVGSG